MKNLHSVMIALCGLSTALTGCGGIKEHLRDRAELDGYYQGGTVAMSRIRPNELHAIVMSVAQNRITQENQVNGKPVRAVYVLPQEACAIVAVENLDDARLIKNADVLGVLVQHYRVCGDNASLIGGNELPAAYPVTDNARATLSQARRAALLYGAQTVSFDSYRIDARRIGVGSAKACRQVETVISNDGLLVLHDVMEVCQ